MESRDLDHAPFYLLLALSGWRPRKDVVWTMNRYNRSTVDVREVFQSSIENAFCRCQFGVKWGKIGDTLVGFGPPTKVNFSDIIKLSNLKNSLFGGAPCIVLSYISCISRVRPIANFELKFPKFRCHDNKGQSGLNFNDAIKLPNLVNNKMLRYISANIVLKLPNFRCHGNDGQM